MLRLRIVAWAYALCAMVGLAVWLVGFFVAQGLPTFVSVLSAFSTVFWGLSAFAAFDAIGRRDTESGRWGHRNGQPPTEFFGANRT
jgi:hypothetical protein